MKVKKGKIYKKEMRRERRTGARVVIIIANVNEMDLDQVFFASGLLQPTISNCRCLAFPPLTHST